MNLANYVEQLPRGGKKLFAIQLGVTASYLSRLISGDRAITAERAIQIEDATGGVISRVDLRPDIQWGKPKRPKMASPRHAAILNQTIRQSTSVGQSSDGAVNSSSIQQATQ
ncbi:YdaS family helix-turn-helix protein [Pseudomonas sp. NFACC04-2]|uniref:transcriptional regulator n=1 Tax=Pseudomonas sp. NFACC04-2 TaxID=1566242 RepID=UPI0009304BCC|nr:YdaS family helix-turn-helix protein [Pseudomonas sp. NFACC04-2]